MRRSVEAEEYHSKDFEWEELKTLVENDPSLAHHVRFRHEQESREHETAQDRDSFTLIDPQAWQNFHSRHSSGKFFKERRYLLKEFPELLSCGENSKLLEVGCGNGSTVLPILRGCKNLTVYACDCSTEALVRTKENIDHSTATSDNFHSFCCDFSRSEFPKWLACDHCRENVLHKQLGSHLDTSCPSSHEFLPIQPTEDFYIVSSASKADAKSYQGMFCRVEARWPALVQGLWAIRHDYAAVRGREMCRVQGIYAVRWNPLVFLLSRHC